MAPKTPRASTMMKRCNIAVIGPMGKDVKTHDIEKWTLNNGGTFSRSIDSKTTHVICKWETFKANDFALYKEQKDKKKPHFVEWAWMEKSLTSRKVQSPGKYAHTRLMNAPAKVKKTAKRQALLLGKDAKELEKAATDKLAKPKNKKRSNAVKEDDNEDEEEEEDADIAPPKKRTRKSSVASTSSYLDKPDLNFSTFVDSIGVEWSIHLTGAELPEKEELNYHLFISVTTTGDDKQYYKAQYTYSEPGEPEDGPLMLWSGSSMDTVIAHFKGFYKNKTGEDWNVEYARRTAALGVTEDDVTAIGAAEEGQDSAAVGEVQDNTETQEDQNDNSQAHEDNPNAPTELEIALMKRYADSKAAVNNNKAAAAALATALSVANNAAATGGIDESTIIPAKESEAGDVEEGQESQVNKAETLAAPFSDINHKADGKQESTPIVPDIEKNNSNSLNTQADSQAKNPAPATTLPQIIEQEFAKDQATHPPSEFKIPTPPVSPKTKLVSRKSIQAKSVPPKSPQAKPVSPDSKTKNAEEPANEDKADNPEPNQKKKPANPFLETGKSFPSPGSTLTKDKSITAIEKSGKGKDKLVKGEDEKKEEELNYFMMNVQHVEFWPTGRFLPINVVIDKKEEE